MRVITWGIGVLAGLVRGGAGPLSLNAQSTKPTPEATGAGARGGRDGLAVVGLAVAVLQVGVGRVHGAGGRVHGIASNISDCFHT